MNMVIFEYSPLVIVKGSRAEDIGLPEYEDFPNSARMSQKREIFNLVKREEARINFKTKC